MFAKHYHKNRYCITQSMYVMSNNDCFMIYGIYVCVEGALWTWQWWLCILY